MDARFVAKVGYRDMMKGKPISVPDWYYKVYKFILRFAPECSPPHRRLGDCGEVGVLGYQSL